jgi:hypothetical protein
MDDEHHIEKPIVLGTGLYWYTYSDIILPQAFYYRSAAFDANLKYALQDVLSMCAYRLGANADNASS